MKNVLNHHQATLKLAYIH